MTGWWFACHFLDFPRNIGFLIIIPLDELHHFSGRGGPGPPTRCSMCVNFQHFTEADDGKTQAGRKPWKGCDFWRECRGVRAVTSIASIHSMQNILISSIVENPMAEYHETVLMIFNTLSILFNSLSNRNINRW